MTNINVSICNYIQLFWSANAESVTESDETECKVKNCVKKKIILTLSIRKTCIFMD